MKYSLDTNVSQSKYWKGVYAEFEGVYYAVMYVNTKENSVNTSYIKNSLDYCLIK